MSEIHRKMSVRYVARVVGFDIDIERLRFNVIVGIGLLLRGVFNRLKLSGIILIIAIFSL
jgi:hypothetical protein